MWTNQILDGARPLSIFPASTSLSASSPRCSGLNTPDPVASDAAKPSRMQ